MKIKYQNRRFNNPDTVKLVGEMVGITDAYMADGFNLTVRQLYYQLVAADLIENSQRSYKRIVDLTSRARLGGMMDWDAIEDRTRSLRGLVDEKSPEYVLANLADTFHVSLWHGSAQRVEVWMEKEALSQVVSTACQPWDVDYFICRGYGSLSELKKAGDRIAYYLNNFDQPTHIIQLSDHDPSGLDMEKDIKTRLSMFAGVDVPVHRLALTYEQVEELKPPPNPAKTTDSRYRDYANRFGSESWELDAIRPHDMVDLISDAIAEFEDSEPFNKRKRLRMEHRNTFMSISDHYQEVQDFLWGLQS